MLNVVVHTQGSILESTLVQRFVEIQEWGINSFSYFEIVDAAVCEIMGADYESEWCVLGSPRPSFGAQTRAACLLLLLIFNKLESPEAQFPGLNTE